MTHSLELPEDPVKALALLRAASADASVVVFKRSPTCPVSHKAEWEFKKFLQSLPEKDNLIAVTIDVLARRSLARGLTAALEIEHESPQALWFEAGELSWHDSHGALTAACFGTKRP
ncbi:MAG: hypothetical protein CMJ86_02145 [Planctomycetes bacterium]|nr:hypothetical protein [Planctomycetota bacterium]